MSYFREYFVELFISDHINIAATFRGVLFKDYER